MEIISAVTIVNETIKAEEEHKARARKEAERVLEEYNFNERVRIAAMGEQWKLREPITFHNRDVATEAKRMLEEVGYIVSLHQDKIKANVWNATVAWSRKNIRNMEG